MKNDSQKIRQFIVENFLYGRPNGLTDHDSFLEHGIIDSTGMLELITFIEQEYSVQIEDEELVPDNLDSIERLVAFVQQKRTAHSEKNDIDAAAR